MKNYMSEYRPEQVRSNVGWWATIGSEIWKRGSSRWSFDDPAKKYIYIKYLG